MFAASNNTLGSGTGGTTFAFGGGAGAGASGASNTASGFSFGGNNNASTGAPTGASSFTFGNNNAAPAAGAAGGFSFGAKPAASAPAAASGGLFGSNTNTSNTTLGANTLAAPAPAPSLGGGLFGAKPATPAAPATGGFSFGAKPATPAAPAAGGFSFGAKPAATTTSAPALGGGLFGAKPAAPASAAGGFSFGAKPAAPAPTAGGLFGNTNTATTGFGSNTLFNNNNSNNLNINNANAAATTNAPITTTTTSIGTFPTPSNTALLTTNNPQPTTTSPTYSPTINDKLDKLRTQIQKSGIFYNAIPLQPGESATFSRPEDFTPQEWESALKNKPDYPCIPVKWIGYEQLFARNKQEEEHVHTSRKVLGEIKDRLQQINDKHELHTHAGLIKCRKRQRGLEVKLLRIAVNLIVLKFKGYPLNQDEENLVSKFGEMLERIDGGKLGEIWAKLESLTISTQSTNSNSFDSDKLVKATGDIQEAISTLVTLIEQDLKTMENL
ncbi:FG-nucleoporin [Martiniozyma asiatica (nom. inval.)]|nr:FG-nucleoporin [Martiniozyma asiatica]